MKQGQMTADLNFKFRIARTVFANCPRYNIEMNQYPLRVRQFAYCPWTTRPMRTHEGACPHFTSPHHVPLVYADF